MYNVHIGNYTGQQSTGNSNVFIGYAAGYHESGNQKLYIENSQSASPLIYGEFDNDFLKINGELQVSESVNFAISTITANTTLDNSYYTILVNANSSSITITLPNATTIKTGRIYVVKAIDVTNTITVNTTATQNIDDATSYIFSVKNEVLKVQSNGTQWYVID